MENSKKEDYKGMLGQVVEDLESQAEECVLNLDSAVSYGRFLNVGTV